MGKSKHIKVTGEDNAVFMVDISKILAYSQDLSLLYVEIDDEIREETCDIVENLFSEVILAKDGQEGIEAFTNFYEENDSYPDIVISNVEMPKKSGIEMCQEIFKLNPTQMVLIASKQCKNEDFIELIRMNIHYFLLQPMEFEQLYTTLYDASKICHTKKVEVSHDDEMDTLNQALHQTITQLQQSVETEKNTSKIKDAFFANMSHEIRTPMNAVMGLSHILLETDLDDKQYDYISKIKKSSDLLLEIINDILDFSKIEAGKLDIEYIEFNINDVLDNISNIINLKSHEKGLELIFNIDKSVPNLIKGDPLRLGQVLINLLNNAVKFTDKGEVTLSVNILSSDENSSVIEFNIADTGIGLTEEQLDKLFQSFSQADESTSRKYGGSGLGLTISKQLVEMMGGGINAYSEYEKGSEFVFTIETKLKEEKRNYRLPSKSLMNKHVLIIDKNQKTIEALSTMLGYFHYTTVGTVDTSEIDSLVEANNFDLVCINYDTLSTFKGQLFKEDFNAKIVILKNGLSISDESSINNIEIDSYLPKPFTQQMIFTMILKVFNNQRIEKRENKELISKKALHVLKGSHIYIAEDNKINQTVMLALLEDTGIEVTILNNGQEVLDQLTLDNDIDLILMDINMPVMGGIEAVEEIRKNSDYDEIPILALTASASHKNIKETQNAGMVEHITKPINVNTLYNFLLQYIQPKEIEEVETEEITEIEEAVEENPFHTVLKESCKVFDEINTNFDLNQAIELTVKIKDEAKENEMEIIYDTTHLLEEIFTRQKSDLFLIVENYTSILEPFTLASDIFKESPETNNEEIIHSTLNTKEGLARFNGDNESYREQLFDFTDTYRDSDKQIYTIIDAAQFEQLLNYIHTIQEDSELIGAVSIYKNLANLELNINRFENDFNLSIQNYKDVCNSLF